MHRAQSAHHECGWKRGGNHRRICSETHFGVDADGPLMEAKRSGPGFARAGTTRLGVRLLDVPTGTPPGGALRRRGLQRPLAACATQLSAKSLGGQQCTRPRSSVRAISSARPRCLQKPSFAIPLMSTSSPTKRTGTRHFPGHFSATLLRRPPWTTASASRRNQGILRDVRSWQWASCTLPRKAHGGAPRQHGAGRKADTQGPRAGAARCAEEGVRLLPDGARLSPPRQPCERGEGRSISVGGAIPRSPETFQSETYHPATECLRAEAPCQPPRRHEPLASALHRRCSSRPLRR